ncbi:MAG: xanthine dehydrogenase molybdopterin binding subunit [Polyangiaceae bacterium]
MASGFSFTLNGKSVAVHEASTNQSLLSWLRENGHTGSKEGCAEGDCGACTVAFVERDAQGRTTYRAINSCITLVPMVAGREVVTVEGLADIEKGTLHPVQDAMVEAYGSQCGYCTPGFVVSMFEAYYRDDLGSTDAERKRKVGDQLNGNLCRCTGYRPIREAMMDALARKKTAGADLFQLRLKRAADPLPPLTYEHGEQTFLRPTTLRELLALRSQFPKAELVCGATEIGVYINKKGTSYATLISTEAVRELTAITKTDEAFTIGGAASLTAVEEALAGEYPMIDKMLWVFASRQIRSRASIAGNIVTASPIGDTPPLLLALDADVVLESVHGKRVVAIADFFTGYRKSVLGADEVVTAIVLPRGKGKAHTRLSDSYKVSKRRELDISIAAAAFVVDLDENGIVVHARLAYGGVAATPARAKKAETHLVGKPWNEATMLSTCAVLREEFTPLSDVRSGKDFRVGLVATLFEKFFRGDRSEAQDTPIVFDDANPDDVLVVVERPRGLKHESARGHVTGGARYVDDESRRRPMLEMWPVLSKVAAGKLVRVDTEAASNMPGVHCILTAKDIPGDNDIGAVRKDEPLLAEGDIRFHGQMIAMVVAGSYEEAKRAAEKVVVEVEEAPAILGIAEAIAKESFHTQPHVIARGDVAAALAVAPHRVQGVFECGGQEHFYLESQAAWAEWGDDDDVFVSSSTQHPSEIQAVISHVMHVPRNKVTVQAPRMGGGFGGKETQGNGFAALAVLAAKKTRKPVRVQLDRDIDMTVTGKRHPFHFRYEAGFENDGRIKAARVFVVNDGGYALDLSESICDRALFHLDNAYFIPNVHFEGRVAKTNAVSHTAFRGFGGPQGMLAMEEILDRIARTLGIRPEVVRERNLYRGTGETNTTHYGQALEDERIPHMWNALMSSSSFAERRDEIAAWNAKSPKIKRGIAITPVKFGISFTATFLNQAGALVHVYRDGTVQVNHGGTEMGQGLYTKMQGVAMRALGLSEDHVRVMRTQTDKVPNTSATAASSGSDLNGQAVKHACDQIRERLEPLAKDLLAEKAKRPVNSVYFADNCVVDGEDASNTLTFKHLAEKAYVAQINLSANGFYRTPGIGYDRLKGKGKPFYYFAYGAAVTEVEVDGYSGMKRILRVDILTDVGESLNPGVDRGQIEGAFVQGAGWLTSEELKWDPKGRLLTHSASTYQIPAIGDAPKDFRVSLLKNAAQPGVIHGSKAVGEPPLMLAMSVREAIRDAVAAFGEPGREVPLASPATHEAIYAAIQAR